jgi:hypothetical protein
VSGYLCRNVPFIESIITSELEPNKKAEAIGSLAKANRIGNRGYARIDLWVLGFIGLTLIASVIAYWRVYIHGEAILKSFNLAGYIVCLISILFGMVLVLLALHKQRNPSCDLIREVINKVQVSENLNI